MLQKHLTMSAEFGYYSCFSALYVSSAVTAAEKPKKTDLGYRVPPSGIWIFPPFKMILGYWVQKVSEDYHQLTQSN